MSTKPRKPHRVDLDPVGLAINGARKFTAEERAPLEQPLQAAFAAFRSGAGTVEHWAALADALNVAVVLAEMQIASDHGATFQRGQTALAAVAERRSQGRGWTMYGAEITALDDAVFVHGIQLRECSQREMANAITTVRNRIRGALAGAAPQGARVCNPGLLGR